ncbi:hypothetical protein SAMN05421640_3114 [Ekhidna lutea]|uniref:Uncharacterized protein n=1 Tax=Ekhidna lutea TaxID=447679 RepID=A0A239LCM5_EKHLU|nr:hypothetical protein [Ekhidna lutea]SNT27603.1 hypothetical protein SAMN05421640_3114 [Ekhidna lutea]
MRLAIISILLFGSINIYGNKSYEPYTVEKKILILSIHLDAEMMDLSKYKNLKVFCNDNSYRETIFSLLDQIHTYHDMLEKELQITSYNHSKRTISRILRHMDHLDRKFNPDDFTGFFREQCSIQSKIEKYSDHYKAGFASHSYGSKVYAQEVVMYRYLKRLTKKVKRIKRHVEHFYIRRKVWEH